MKQTLRESAKMFKPKVTKNISELPEVPVDAEIFHDGSGADKDGEAFTYSYLMFNNEEYRVPGVVLGQLKVFLEEKPDMKTFKVKRTGEGKFQTRYQVIPLS